MNKHEQAQKYLSKHLSTVFVSLKVVNINTHLQLFFLSYIKGETGDFSATCDSYPYIYILHMDTSSTQQSQAHKQHSELFVELKLVLTLQKYYLNE